MEFTNIVKDVAVLLQHFVNVVHVKPVMFWQVEVWG